MTTPWPRIVRTYGAGAQRRNLNAIANGRPARTRGTKAEVAWCLELLAWRRKGEQALPLSQSIHRAILESMFSQGKEPTTTP